MVQYLPVIAKLMAVEFHFRGIKYRADTPEEAVRLREVLEKTDAKKASTDPAFRRLLFKEESGWTEERFWQMLEGLKARQIELVKVLALFAKGQQGIITADELTEELALSSKVALGGVLGGLSRQLAKMGMKSSQIFNIETEWDGKSKDRTFFTTPGFTAVVKETGWPCYLDTPKEIRELERQEKRKKK